MRAQEDPFLNLEGTPSSPSYSHTQSWVRSWVCTSLQSPTSNSVSRFMGCCVTSTKLRNAFILTQRTCSVHSTWSWSFSISFDFVVLPFKGVFMNRQVKSSLGGGRQGSMNWFCKQGNQGKERLSNTGWLTERRSGRTRLLRVLALPAILGSSSRLPTEPGFSTQFFCSHQLPAECNWPAHFFQGSGASHRPDYLPITAGPWTELMLRGIT